MVQPAAQTSQLVTESPAGLDDRKRRAAALMAETTLSNSKIAEEIGVSRKTLWLWTKEPAFAKYLQELNEELDQETRRYAVGRRRSRLQALQERQDKLLTVVEERAEWFAKHEPTVPGGTTGYVVKRIKGVGSGPYTHIVNEYEFDVALSKELREVEKQAAIEVGQWTEKQQIDAAVSVGGPVTITERRVLRMPRRSGIVDAESEEVVEGEFREKPAEKSTVEQTREADARVSAAYEQRRLEAENAARRQAAQRGGDY